MKPLYNSVIQIWCEYWHYENFFNAFSCPKLYLASGSGFCVEIEGKKYIISNYHVIERSRVISGKFDNDKEELQIMFSDPIADIVILSCPFKNIKPLKIGTAATGDIVYTMGYPLHSRTMNISKGVMSKITKEIYNTQYKGLVFFTDASIFPGNSGGPLINEDGEVVGVNFMSYIDYSIYMTIPFFNLDYAIRQFVSGVDDGAYKFIDTDWQVHEKGIEIFAEDKIITHIGGIEIHKDGQIKYSDFLKFYGYDVEDNGEMFSFHYLVSILGKNEIECTTIDNKKIKLRLEEVYEPKFEPPHYASIGAFIIGKFDFNMVKQVGGGYDHIGEPILLNILYTENTKDYVNFERKLIIKGVNGKKVASFDNLCKMIKKQSGEITFHFDGERRKIKTTIKKIKKDSNMVGKTLKEHNIHVII